MKQPEGYDDRTECVYKLKYSLYGLKQSTRCWNHRFVNFIKKQEIKCSSVDPYLFTQQRNGNKLIVVIYVDDYSWIFEQFFGNTDSTNKEWIHFHNSTYAYSERILEKFKMAKSK